MVVEEPTQLPLIPEQAPTVRADEVATSALPPSDRLAGEGPDANLVESIRRWGVLDPLIVRAVGGALRYEDPATFIAGRRRLKAVRFLEQEAREDVRKAAERTALPAGADLSGDPVYREAYERLRRFLRVPVRVVSDPEGTLQDGRTATLAVTSNAVRRANPAVDYEALVALRARLGPLPEKQLVSELARLTGLAPGTVRQRLRLDGLSAGFLGDLNDGLLAYSVALEASRLPAEEQEALRALAVGEGTPLTLADVKQAKKNRVQDAQATLFDALPEAPEGGTLPGAADETSRARADRMIETLRSTNLPVCLEAASLIADLALEAQEAHDRVWALEGAQGEAGS